PHRLRAAACSSPGVWAHDLQRSERGISEVKYAPEWTPWIPSSPSFLTATQIPLIAHAMYVPSPVRGAKILITFGLCVTICGTPLHARPRRFQESHTDESGIYTPSNHILKPNIPDNSARYNLHARSRFQPGNCKFPVAGVHTMDQNKNRRC